MNWTEIETNTAIGLLKDGLTYQEISNSIEHRNYEAVKRKLLTLGLSYSMFGGKPETLPEGRKRCGKCREVKFIDEFSKKKSNVDGLQQWCKVCSRDRSNYLYNVSDKTKHKENVKKGNKKRIDINRKRVYDYLLSNPCIDCGEDDPIVLEFDHRDDVEKIGVISTMVWDYGWKNIKKEIDKCDVRCSNCHKRRTAKQFGWYKFLND